VWTLLQTITVVIKLQLTNAEYGERKVSGSVGKAVVYCMVPCRFERAVAAWKEFVRLHHDSLPLSTIAGHGIFSDKPAYSMLSQRQESHDSCDSVNEKR